MDNLWFQSQVRKVLNSMLEIYPLVATDFPDLPRLQLARQMSVHNVRGGKKLSQELKLLADRWLPYHIFVDCAHAPYGMYWWVFAVELKQERRWALPEFQLGCDHARLAEQPRRENPYPTFSGRDISWDRGYIFGLMIRYQSADLTKLKPEFRPVTAVAG